MIIRCQNKECNTKMSIKDDVIHNPDANIKCPSCKQKFKPFDRLPLSQKESILKQKATGKQKQESKNKAIGWLIVHDENTESQTHDLSEGTQVVGRKSESKPCDIMIKTSDKRFGRNHFTVEVKQRSGNYNYVLKGYDDKNGTYVETKMLQGFAKEMRRVKTGEEVYIEDGDIIQAGKTKIILKTIKTTPNRETATEIVNKQEISKTIIV